MKTIQDCIKFSNENPMCYLATADGDQPRVRALEFWYADETGFYFQTGAMKELYLQLRKNPKVEVCFYRHENMIGSMLRLAGKIEVVDGKGLKEKVLKDRPYLQNMGMTAESAELIIFRIAHGEAYFWTMENNLNPKEFIKF